MPNGNHLDTNQALEQLVAGVGVVGVLGLLATYFSYDDRVADPLRDCIRTVNENQKNYSQGDYGYRVGNRRRWQR